VASPQLGHSGQLERIKVKHSRIRRALKSLAVSPAPHHCFRYSGDSFVRATRQEARNTAVTERLL
jgi:hypothetical protein